MFQDWVAGVSNFFMVLIMRIVEQQGTWSDYSHIFIQKLFSILVSQVATMSQTHNFVK
jgi:hypothetical protein